VDADYEKISDEVRRGEVVFERSRQLAAEQRGDDGDGQGGEAGASGKGGKAPSDVEKRADEHGKAFRKFLRGGENALSGEEKRALQEFRGTASQVTTSPGLGGVTVPQDFAGEVEKTMVMWGGMMAACRVVPTETGALLPWPVVDDSTVEGAIIGEGVADSVADVAFSALNLSAFTYTSKNVKVSKELVNDSFFNLDSLIAELLGERLGRITNKHFTDGTGTGQPRGLFTAAPLGKTVASATTFTAAELLDLIHSVDPAYRLSPKAGFVFNDSTLKIIKQLTIGGGTDTRPLWVPSMREAEPDKVWGFGYTINQNAPVIAAAAKVIAFGDLSKYIIRQVRQQELVVMRERFADERVVAFNLFARYDGNLVNTNAVKHLRMA
jgi:HK97 family phage major capsid protein